MHEDEYSSPKVELEERIKRGRRINRMKKAERTTKALYNLRERIERGKTKNLTLSSLIRFIDEEKAVKLSELEDEDSIAIYIEDFLEKMVGKSWAEIVDELKARGASLEQVETVLDNNEVVYEIVGGKKTIIKFYKDRDNYEYIDQVEWDY